MKKHVAINSGFLFIYFWDVKQKNQTNEWKMQEQNIY